MKKTFRKFVPLAFLLVTVAASAGETAVLSYRTFIDYAKEGKVKSVMITESCSKELKVTVDENGVDVTYDVDKPYKVGEDSLLLDLLTEKKIPHQILEESGSGKGSSRNSFFWAGMMPMITIFALPVLVLVVIVVLAFIIFSKISHVERMLESGTQK